MGQSRKRRGGVKEEEYKGKARRRDRLRGQRDKGRKNKDKKGCYGEKNNQCLQRLR